MNETRTLGQYAADGEFADLPGDVIVQLKRLILDQLGCQISAASLPWSLVVYDAIRKLAGRGPASVVVHGDRLAIDEAVFVNSAFGHGNEVDDAHMGVRTHPGAVLVPAVIAIAEAEPTIDGANLLAALSVGCEVMLRVADAAMPALMDVRHHNTPSSAGPFGVAAAVCRSLAMTPGQTEHALSVVGYHSSGLMQYTVGGGSVKRIQTSIGAKSGVRAALLVAGGFTGPKEILEGTRGFLAAFSGEGARERLVAGLGSTYLSLGTCYKRFNVKYRLHASIDGLLMIFAEHGITFGDIAAIRVGVSEASRQLVGISCEPRDVVEAQLSMRFALAAVAKYGPAALGDVGPTELHDAEVLDLARRVEVYRDPDQEREPWMNWGCALTILCRDDKRLTVRVAAPVGSPRNPIDDVLIEEKFHRLVDPILGHQRARAIVDVVRHLEDALPSRDLIPLLVARPTR